MFVYSKKTLIKRINSNAPTTPSHSLLLPHSPLLPEAIKLKLLLLQRENNVITYEFESVATSSTHRKTSSHLTTALIEAALTLRDEISHGQILLLLPSNLSRFGNVPDGSNGVSARHATCIASCQRNKTIIPLSEMEPLKIVRSLPKLRTPATMRSKWN
ncbi:hypothetical protein GWI33_019788 [Rhynchophorus ferrugineus]|uniref:Uncharacterized protein n=1 Tax=Rhynchophorus ferrugineus TaxID=354439 RepID=A0A834M053_RHYFE|nr:hypothetical protein GWI33_019788 [Rhynchophorus ferrugineus]